MFDKVVNKIHNIFPDWLINAVNEKGGFFLAGGFFTSTFTRKDINDLDLYFVNKASLSEFIKCLNEDEHWCTFISDKSLNYYYDGYNIQLIHYAFYEDLSAIFHDYDFTINMCGWDSRSDKIEHDPMFLVHNSQRYLSFNPNTRFALLSALRVQKYSLRGYYIPRNQFVKIMLAVNKMKIDSWKEFKAQCGGLYGLNYVTDETIGNKEFSIENAFDVIENTSFEGRPITEYKIDPRVVAYILSGEPIKYLRHKYGITIVGDAAECPRTDFLVEAIQDGSVNSEEVSVQDYLGEYIYKWVRQDLSSHYDRTFQYKLNTKISGKQNWCYTSPKLWLCTWEGLDRATYADQGVILRCKYDEKDIVEVNNGEVIMSSVTPVEIITREQYKAGYKGAHND